METQAGPAIGTTVGGRYTVDGVLGVGGMGYVYSARGTNGNPVALKVLHPELLTNNVAVTRFMTEAETIFKLRHPNIVEVFDYGRGADRTLFIAMEVLTGTTVVDEIQARGAIPREEALQVVTETARALAAAHEAGVVHRDLKPENLMMVPRGDGGKTVKVLDFGLAIVMEENRMEMHRKRVTQQDVVMGTPGYMSPEQIHGFDVDARADLYALGVIWWEMLTGRQLFSGRSSVEIMMRHIEERPPHPQKVNPRAAISQPAAQLLAALLEKNKDDRPPDGAAVLNYLNTMARSSTPPSFQMSGTGPPRTATPTTSEVEIDLAPTGLELAGGDGPALDASGRMVSGAQSKYGSVPQRTYDELWTIERPDGTRETGIPKDQLIKLAREGLVTARDKVGIEGRQMMPAHAMSFLGVRPPDVMSKPPEVAKAPLGSVRRSRAPMVWAAVLLAVGAAAGYTVTQQPQWIEGARTWLAQSTAGWGAEEKSEPLSALFDQSVVARWKKGVKALPPLGEGQEKAVRIELAARVARGRDDDRRVVDRRLQRLMLAGATETETLALYVRNRAEMPNGRSALKQERIEEVMQRARRKLGQNDHLRLAQSAVARRLGQAGVGRSELVRMGESLKDPDELRLVARALLDLDLDAAERVVSRGRELWPQTPALLSAEASVALRRGDLKSAREAVQRRLAIEPRDADALRCEAQLKVLSQDATGAYQRLQAHLDVAPYDAELRLLAIQIAVHDLDDNKMAAALTRDRTTVSNEPPLLTAYRAAVDHRAGAAKDAESTLAALKARRTRFPVAHLLDADFALSEGDKKRAQIAAQNALDAGADAMFPTLARTLLGEAFLEQKKLEPAREAFAWANDHDPERLEPLVGLLHTVAPNDPAVVKSLLGRDPLAFVDRRGAYDMPPVGLRPRFKARMRQGGVSGVSKDWAAGLLDLERGDADKATVRFYRALGRDKSNAALRVYYAAALVQKGQPERALDALDEVADAQESLAVVSVRARALVAAGAAASDTRVALDQLELTLGKLPQSARTERLRANAETLRAQLAEREGAVDAARLRYQSAFTRDRWLRPAGAGLARLSS